jgi:hypothetical protein
MVVVVVVGAGGRLVAVVLSGPVGEVVEDETVGPPQAIGSAASRQTNLTRIMVSHSVEPDGQSWPHQ